MRPNDTDPAAMVAPIVKVPIAPKAKNTSAKASPSLPSANRQTGSPMLPVSGKITAGR